LKQKTRCAQLVRQNRGRHHHKQSKRGKGCTGGDNGSNPKVQQDESAHSFPPINIELQPLFSYSSSFLSSRAQCLCYRSARLFFPA
ncbi:Uncharacterized protein APZ42_002300, partial [Daphnia magna]